MEIVLWGERGLINGLVLDLDYASKKDGKDILLWEILCAIEFCGNMKSFRDLIDFNSIKDVVLFLEADLNDFGNPDLILLIELKNNRKIIVLVEAKAKSYKKSSQFDNPERRAKQGFNSSINGQLELNYRLSKVLSNYKPVDRIWGNTDRILEEEPWVLNSGYRYNLPNSKTNKNSNLQLKRVSRLKHSVVMGNIVNRISGEPIENYFHVVITNDRTNPFLDPRSNLPRIFSTNSLNKSQWESRKDNFGFISYKNIADVFLKKLIYGKFLESYNLNIEKMEGEI